MYIRSNTWAAGNLSWSGVVMELLYSAEKMGHKVHLISTNGTLAAQRWTEQRHMADVEAERMMRKSGQRYDIDITYTVPINFHSRFLNTSKVKIARLDYESSHPPVGWREHYKYVDFLMPASRYAAEMFERNGCPKDKIHVVHHGVDPIVFNEAAAPIQLPTSKSFKFLCVAEPHYRKQLDRLLEVYCKTFTSKDDICLILKTKIFKPGEEMKGFEMDLKPKLIELQSKYGKDIPEIKIITKRMENIAALYTACDAFCLMTASEGWGMPFLEAMACGLTVVAPRHGGQLDFLNDENSILCDTGTRLARNEEQYWGQTFGATVGNPDENHFSSLLKDVYMKNKEIKERLKPGMRKTVLDNTWDNAMASIIDIARTTGRI